MSKSSKNRVKRIAQPAANRLTEPEMVDIMLGPHLHLEMLLGECTPNPYYLASIVGVFNVATALSYLHKDKRSIRLYEATQLSLRDIAQSGVVAPETAARLKKVLGIADKYIEVQSKADVLRAINLVKYQLAHGDGNILLGAGL